MQQLNVVKVKLQTSLIKLLQVGLSRPQVTLKGQLCASEESWFRCIDLPTIQLRGNGIAEWRSILEVEQERGRRDTIERGKVTTR